MEVLYPVGVSPGLSPRHSLYVNQRKKKWKQKKLLWNGAGLVCGWITIRLWRTTLPKGQIFLSACITPWLQLLDQRHAVWSMVNNDFQIKKTLRWIKKEMLVTQYESLAHAGCAVHFPLNQHELNTNVSDHYLNTAVEHDKDNSLLIQFNY
jgi:hypothetical protein